jgi:3-deoxy-7-phosphoheptulonate synthase
MIEVHNDPKNALCDGAQSLNLAEFDGLMENLKKRVAFEANSHK